MSAARSPSVTGPGGQTLPWDAVVIGASAGGLEALQVILGPLPARFPLPILLVQHLHASDGGRYARFLDQALALAVGEATDKQPVQAGCVHVAPAGYHLLVEQDGSLALSVDPKVHWSRPSIDMLFESAAQVWGDRLLGVILSGASVDGAEGMCRIRAYGGRCIAQDPESASHPLMPEAAIEQAGIEIILSPSQIAARLLSMVGLAREEGA